MRKNWFLRFILAGLLVVGLSTSVQALPFAELVLLDSDITVGETFEVEVLGHADGLTALDSFGFPMDEWLSFAFETTVAGTAFSWDSATMGPSFDDDSFFFPSGYVAGSAFPGLIDEVVLLATLEFTALEVGDGSVSVFGDSFLYEGMGFWFEGFVDIDASLDITVNEGTNPVPEPATMLLFGLGLLGMAGVSRKK